MITIEEFKKLKREDMFVQLVAVDPARAKGKTRAPKDKLIEAYEQALTQKAAESTGFGAARIDDALAAFTEASERAEEGIDPYRVAAARLFHVEYDAVTNQQRNAAKTTLFARIYGSEAPVLETGVPALDDAMKDGVPPERMRAKPGMTFSEALKLDTDLHTKITNAMFGDEMVSLDSLKDVMEEDELAVVVAHPATGAVDPNLLGVTTGRLSSKEPNLSALEARLQQTPLRTEEAKELRGIMAPDGVTLEADYSSIERRIMSEHNIGQDDFSPAEARMADAMGLGGVGQAAMDAFDREKPYGGGLPPGTAVLGGYDHSVSTGIEGSMVTNVPVGVVVSRREVVVRAVSKLGRERITVIAHYRAVPKNGNRKQRKIAESLRRQINRFLPKGITLDEAVAVLS